MHHLEHIAAPPSSTFHESQVQPLKLPVRLVKDSVRVDEFLLDHCCHPISSDKTSEGLIDDSNGFKGTFRNCTKDPIVPAEGAALAPEIRQV